MEIDVYSIQDAQGRIRCLGTAKNFGEAKRMQQNSLPDDLKPLYAGIHNGMPLFYADELTPEIMAKYPAIGAHG